MSKEDMIASALEKAGFGNINPAEAISEKLTAIAPEVKKKVRTGCIIAGAIITTVIISIVVIVCLALWCSSGCARNNHSLVNIIFIE